MVIMLNSYYEFAWDINYCYPNSFVLRNKLNIKNKEELEKAERQITSIKILDLKMNPLKGNLDFDHLLSIHKYIFIDIYPWAGMTRTVNISKGNPFCDFKYINDVASELFAQLHREHYLIGLNQKQVIERLAYYLGELNAIHPFREGNGRTQRLFIEYLGLVAGYHVNFTKISSQEMIDASVDSFLKKYDKMNKLFEKAVTPISIEKQEEFINLLATKSSEYKKIFYIWKEQIYLAP